MCVIGDDLRRHAKLGGLVFDRLRALLFATAVSVYDTLPQNTYVDNKEKKNPEVVYFTNSLYLPNCIICQRLQNKAISK